LRENLRENLRKNLREKKLRNKTRFEKIKKLERKVMKNMREVIEKRVNFYRKFGKN
jgi:hypothetical protein